MISLESFINRFFTSFIVIGLIFGVLFYDYIVNLSKFNYIDEILALALILFTFTLLIKKKLFEKYWLYLFIVFIFYFIYSVRIHSNSFAAIAQDATVQIKPFIGFFCAYSLAPTFTEKQKKIIKSFCVFSFFILIVFAFDIGTFMGHPSRYATATTIVAFLYLFSCKFEKKDIYIFILMFALSILSTRSKAYGFFVIASCMILFYYFNLSFKFSIKQIIFISCILVVAAYFTWEKIYYYFIYGGADAFGNDVEYAFARPALYVTSWQILLDYIPFGCGFSSFATNFSGVYYSDIYYQYGLNNLYGLSEEMPDFISDTFFPALAQFGFFGILVYLFFWIFIVKTVNKYKDKYNAEKRKLQVMVICIIIFFFIESVADSTFTHNRGFFMMILMGLSLSGLKNDSLEQEYASGN